MRVIIIGAGGEIGRHLTEILSVRNNDVIAIEQDPRLVEELAESMDIMTICGNGATVGPLRRAGIEQADMLLAVSNNSEANILACNIASHYGVAVKVARLRTSESEYFAGVDGLSPESLGVDNAIFPEYECSNNILDALLRPAIRETVQFSHPDAQLVNFQLKPGSPMIGSRLIDFSRQDLLEQLRICAIVRYGQLIIPRGQTGFLAFDEVYAAGSQGAIDDLISWAEPQSQPISKVVIAGGTTIGRLLASVLATADMNVCVIEPDPAKAHMMADALGSSAVILHGGSTDRAVLEEAGIAKADAFIACHKDNETNILSCIMAKRHGAGKVIAVTNNADYVRIIAGMTMIDCCFSPIISAINVMIGLIGSDKRRTIALLKRTSAEVAEFTVTKQSPVCGKPIKDCACPEDMVFALILREKDLLPATGDTELIPGDRVVMLAKEDAVERAEKLFVRPLLWKG